MKMKKIINIFSLGLLSILLVTSCKKNTFSVKETNFIDGKTSLKVNYFSAYQAKPTYQIKIDGSRVSNNLNFPTPFPGGGLNTGGGSYADYLAVAPGTRTVAVSIQNVGTNNDSIALASANVSLDANKFYSLYFVDTATNTSQILFEDDLTAPDSGFVKYRFINLMVDLPAGVDLYFGTGSTSATSAIVASSVAYKQSSPYFTLPINTGTVWSIRPAGAAASTTAIATYTSASSTTNQRVYSIVARGYNAISTPTTDGRIRAISLIFNR